MTQRNAADRRRKRKVLVFSYFEDTVDYVEDYLCKVIATDNRLVGYRERIASVAGNDSRHGVGRERLELGPQALLQRAGCSELFRHALDHSSD